VEKEWVILAAFSKTLIQVIWHRSAVVMGTATETGRKTGHGVGGSRVERKEEELLTEGRRVISIRVVEKSSATRANTWGKLTRGREPSTGRACLSAGRFLGGDREGESL